MQKSLLLPLLILLLAFSEGACLMAMELGAARLLAPTFGTSLTAWAATLGITLLALMCGYFFGAFLATKQYAAKLPAPLLLLAAITTALSPLSASYFLHLFRELPVQTGATLSLLLFAFVPLFFLASSSPLLILLFQAGNKNAGQASGRIFAISTLGGIVATFYCGFYALPFWGVQDTLLFFAALLAVFSMCLWIFSSKWGAIGGLSACFLAALISFASTSKNNPAVLYSSDGILGKMEVIDRPMFSFVKGDFVDARSLMINGTGQSILDKSGSPAYTWLYMEAIREIAHAYAHKKALLLGMGAGVLAQELSKKNMLLTCVELDERIPFLAEKYFSFPQTNTVHIQDARHFINTCTENYHLVLFDLFFSETPPSHALTLETFEQVKNMLDAEGMLVINLYGFTSGKAALPFHAIRNTLLAAGFHVELIATRGEESQRNLLLCATRSGMPEMPVSQSFSQVYIEKNDAVGIVTDNRNPLDVFFSYPAKQWRMGWNKLHEI